MNYNYISSNTGGGGGVLLNGNSGNATGDSTLQQQQQQPTSSSLFSQVPGNGAQMGQATSPGHQLFQSPLNGFSSLRTASSGSNYSTPLMANLDLATASTSSSGTASSSSSYSRQRFLCSKGFDWEDDLEFCPEIVSPQQLNQHHKFNPYTSLVFSPISPPQTVAETASESSPESNVKKTPVQDLQRSLTLSPRVHTPRIKKPLEIINPLTRAKVGSPSINN